MVRRLAPVLALALAACGGDEADVKLVDVGGIPDHVAAGPHGVYALASNDLVRLDGAGGVLDRQAIGRFPAGVATGGDAVWVTDSGDFHVRSVDARTLERRTDSGRPLGSGGASEPIPVAVGAGGVWVGVEDVVIRLDPRTGRLTGPPVRVGGAPKALAVAGGRVFAAIGTGTKYDTRTNGMPDPPGSFLPSGKELTSESTRDSTIAVIDAGSRRLVDRVHPGRDLRDIAAGPSGLWAATGDGLVRLDPATGKTIARVTLGDSVTTVAVGDGIVWAGAAFGNSVRSVDPRTNEPGDKITVPGASGSSLEVADLAAAPDAVFVGSETGESLARVRH